MRRLALFDFDGTVTIRDTLMEFLLFYAGRRRFYTGIIALTPILIAYKLNLVKNWVAKEKVLTYFLGGDEVEKVSSQGRSFALDKIPGFLREEAMERLRWHQQNNDRVIIVSASASVWIRPWTETFGVELIATSLEVSEGKYTGKIAGANCFGPEKERRIRTYLDLAEFDQVYAYGDTRGDREMLAMATHPYYRRFT